MKKFFAIAAIAMMALTANAQNSAIGVGVNYGFDAEAIGIGVKYQQKFSENIRGEVAGTYFLEKDGLKQWEALVNVHYLIPLAETLDFYPLAGLGYYHASIDIPEFEIMGVKYGGGTESDGKFGGQIGAGLDWKVAESVKFNVELKYQHFDGGQLAAGVGIAYVF